MMSQDLQDPIKKATISKMDVPSDKGLKGGAIIFRIEFATKGTFVGMVKTDPTDSKPSTEPMNPIPVSRQKLASKLAPGELDKIEKSVMSKGRFDIREDASADYLARTRSKAIFIDASGARKDIEEVPELKSDTIGAAKKLLSDMVTDASTLEEKDEFEEKISELAAKIAGIDLKEYESEKIDLPNSIKAQINSAIADEKDMAQFVLDMIMEIIPNEKALANLENRAGWSGIFKALKTKSGQKPQGDNSTTSDVSKASSDMDLDALKESYNRIKRK